MHHETLSIIRREETSCPNIEGNSDFYGLGIRVGIYLQWFSSWISNSVNPSAAATNHDTNTVFLCALLIATAVAFADGSLQLVEKYLLLLLSSGFFCTVLSFLGLRLHFLQPSALRAFHRALRKTLRRVLPLMFKLPETNDETDESWSNIGLLRISFRSASKIRHHALSWAGVILRSSVGCFLAILCLLTSWSTPKATADRAEPCVTTVFFFGPRDLSGSLYMFFRASTILLTIPVGCLFLFFLVLLARLVGHGKDWLLRYGVIGLSEAVSPGTWDRLGRREKIILGALIEYVTNPYIVLDPFRVFIAHELFRMWRKFQNERHDQVPMQPRPIGDVDGSDPFPYDFAFWNVDASNCPPFSELLQALMSLFSRGVEARGVSGSEIVAEPEMLDHCLSTVAHVLTLGTMASFILFIERTILVAGISGVNTIRTTGQLIPFVIGVVSLVVALRDLAMLLLWKRYPQWSKRHFVLEPGPLGDVAARVEVEGDREPSSSPAQGVNDTPLTS